MNREMETEFKLIISNILNLSKDYLLAESLKKILNMKKMDELSRYLNNIELVFVGDNPAEEERKQNEYFVGDSGKILKKFICDFLKIDENKCIFLEKSLLPTNRVNELKKYKNDMSQEMMAKLIKIIVELNKNVYVCFLGYTDFFNLHENAIFSSFYNYISDTVDEHKNQFGVFYHPSIYRVFPNKERKRCKEIIKEFEDTSNPITEMIIFKNVGTNMLQDMREIKKLMYYIENFRTNHQKFCESRNNE